MRECCPSLLLSLGLTTCWTSVTMRETVVRFHSFCSGFPRNVLGISSSIRAHWRLTEVGGPALGGGRANALRVPLQGHSVHGCAPGPEVQKAVASGAGDKPRTRALQILRVTRTNQCHWGKEKLTVLSPARSSCSMQSSSPMVDAFPKARGPWSWRGNLLPSRWHVSPAIVPGKWRQTRASRENSEPARDSHSAHTCGP